jgi:hypothetical protein
VLALLCPLLQKEYAQKEHTTSAETCLHLMIWRSIYERGIWKTKRSYSTPNQSPKSSWQSEKVRCSLHSPSESRQSFRDLYCKEAPIRLMCWPELSWTVLNFTQSLQISLVHHALVTICAWVRRYWQKALSFFTWFWNGIKEFASWWFRSHRLQSNQKVTPSNQSSKTRLQWVFRVPQVFVLLVNFCTQSNVSILTESSRQQPTHSKSIAPSIRRATM